MVQSRSADSPLADGAGETSRQSDPNVVGPRARWAFLVLLSVAELLGMSVWFAASAVSADLQRALALTTGQAHALTTVVQLGFVAGTAVAAVFNLADIVPARRYFAISAALAALANALLLAASGFLSALVFRFATGFFLAGVYPPAMKMAATWFKSGRGLAIGTVVGALTLGKALPYLIRSLPAGSLPAVVVATSVAAALAAAAVAAMYRDGPHPFARRPFDWGLVRTVVKHRPTRLATLGYLGHMWELYAVWTAISLFFGDLLTRGGAEDPARAASLAAFCVIGIGAAGSVLAGVWADRLGRERVASGAMMISGACALLVGWLMSAPVALVFAICLVWGFFVVADSAQFSALVTEVAPPHAAGTALTLQTSAGFLLTMITIQATPVAARLLGWGPAFAVLAMGPAFGIWAMRRLHDLRLPRTA